MTASLREEVLTAVASVKDPCSLFNQTDLNLFELGMVHDLTVGDSGSVHIELFLDDPTCIFFFEINRMLHEAVTKVPGVSDFSVDIKADEVWTEERMSAAGSEKLARVREQRRRSLRSGSHGWPLPPLASTEQLGAEGSRRAEQIGTLDGERVEGQTNGYGG
ncbi:MAG TPA: iron-sulfur cluster assembly protein [Nocardioides sp.]|uniref:metal-sulfur cluster assembly factor n=1 Tax=uncultured Nocardioides sp. TaxID=198441 RepID=UPI0026391DA5|nr:iron-sulfur cluster assembly protein [uncultured Nocardioides sp.]HRI94024.1 iron-sulfur cluster assembly protein [Nocardioides sp.]HRK44068.1 iron-sulfur cluster assembly protein [Nocardioides sp.]